MQKKYVKNSAFTLMEIMVVLLIVGFLFAFIGPRIYKAIFKSKAGMTKIKMGKIRNGLIAYQQDIGHLPTAKENGLNALFKRPEAKGAEKWDGPYVDSEDDLVDGWNIPFEYNIPPVKYKDKYKTFEIISPGGEGADAKEIADGI